MKRNYAYTFYAVITCLCFSFIAKADEVEVLQAKSEMASALTKAGLLTNSFTEKAKQDPELAGREIAQQFASNLDQFIVDGLQKNASCEQIKMAASRIINEGFSKDDENLSDVAKKASHNVQVSMKKYVAVRCANLNE